MKTKTILLAGATGYLGRYIAAELQKQDYPVILLVRNKARANFDAKMKVVEGAVTVKDSLMGMCKGVDVVISTVGITRQKDGLTYMQVDYQANMNLLNEAIQAGVKKFIYVSAINGDKYRELKIFEAKERFVDALKNAGLDYVVVRPNGFFSDMGDFLDMAQKGKIYLFGDGNFRLNPIHGADLAEVCVQAIENEKEELIVGGPDILSQNELAKLALKAWSNKPKIVHLPDWIRKAIIQLLRWFTSSKTYGPIEFFLTTMAADNIAPIYGQRRLEDFFKEEVRKRKL